MQSEECSAATARAIVSQSSRRRPSAPALRAWLYVIAWLVIIAVESTDLLSSERTGGLIRYVLTLIFGPISPASFELIHAGGRKIGHFVGYAMLSLLLYRAWRETLRNSVACLWDLRWALLALAGTVLVAVADEWHQTRLISRTGSARDVLLDSLGGIFTQCVILYTALSKQVRA